jgi:histidinol-phosphate/aromatic aminotransferase/cobyric acid decarboxylase-like protein
MGTQRGIPGSCTLPPTATRTSLRSGSDLTSLGGPILRREIARLYRSVTEDQVLVFGGAEEPITVTVAAASIPR